MPDGVEQCHRQQRQHEALVNLGLGLQPCGPQAQHEHTTGHCRTGVAAAVGGQDRGSSSRVWVQGLTFGFRVAVTGGEQDRGGRRAGRLVCRHGRRTAARAVAQALCPSMCKHGVSAADTNNPAAASASTDTAADWTEACCCCAADLAGACCCCLNPGCGAGRLTQLHG